MAEDVSANRLFLDANVLVSALRTPGVCRDLLAAAGAGYFVAVVSVYAREETVDAFARRSLLTKPEIEAALGQVPFETALEPAEPIVLWAKRFISDPDDAPILAAALASHADAPVTGDVHFFTPPVQAKITVLTPREAGDLLRHPSQGDPHA